MLQKCSLHMNDDYYPFLKVNIRNHEGIRVRKIMHTYLMRLEDKISSSLEWFFQMHLDNRSSKERKGQNQSNSWRIHN